MGRSSYLQREIVNAIRKEMEQIDEMADEVWLTEKQLIEEMPFFKKKWVKENGYKLHPRCVLVTDKNGDDNVSKRFYPKNAILKQLRESKIADDALGWSIYNYCLKGGEVEIGGYEFSDDWQKELSIKEIVYHL